MKNLKLVIAVREKKKRSRVQLSYGRGEKVIRDRIKYQEFSYHPNFNCKMFISFKNNSSKVHYVDAFSINIQMCNK